MSQRPPSARKSYLVAMIVAVIIVVSIVGYLVVNVKPNQTSNLTSLPETTTLSNGMVLYVYPSLNASTNIESSITSSTGETFGIQLSSNGGSTGYDWVISTSSGIRSLGNSAVSVSNLPGGQVVRNYYFESLQPGAQSITLQDRRQFSPYDVSATILVHVSVESATAVQSSTTGFQADMDTLPGGEAQLAMLSYNFQLNSTAGTLFIVFKNYSNSTTVFSSFKYDGNRVSNSSLEYDSGCNNFAPGSECGVSLVFEAGALQPPLENSSHSLQISIAPGYQFSFTVTAGMLEEAGCTFNSSC